MNPWLSTARYSRTFASLHGPDGAFPGSAQYACPVTVYPRRSWIERRPRVLLLLAAAFVVVAAVARWWAA